jgi:hypothetical protein
MHPLVAKLFHECFGTLLVSKTEAVPFPPALGLGLALHSRLRLLSRRQDSAAF